MALSKYLMMEYNYVYCGVWYYSFISEFQGCVLWMSYKNHHPPKGVRVAFHPALVCVLHVVAKRAMDKCSQLIFF